jgi:agmatinase
MASGRSSEFPGATAPLDDAQYVLRGAPLDVTGSGQPGARAGPDAIRRAAREQEGYDHRTDARLADRAVHDAGDLDGWPDPAEYVDVLAGDVTTDRDRGAMPILLGGEHTVSLAGIEATEPSVYVALDAHLDLRDTYAGEAICHATVARRALERDGVERAVLLGARSGSAAGWERAARDDVTVVPPGDVPEWRPGFDGPVYLSADVDVVDPAYAPGTGTLEPGGLTSREVLAAIRRIAPHAVGADVVEVQDDRPTAALAAACVRAIVHAHAAA